MKLLIVDDEIFAIQGVLDGVDWKQLPFRRTLQANSYLQAVGLMQDDAADVVLCDVEMPGENGLALIEWIQINCPQSVCVILSCHDDFDYARQAIHLGCMEYVTKPVRYDVLTQILQRACEQVRERRKNIILKEYGRKYLQNITGASSENAGVVETVTGYIDTHLGEDLNVTDLAKMVYVSPDHLTRVFKKKQGCTVSDYIRRQRMELAKQLLQEERVMITAVAELVGFSNYSYFIEQFKKYTGLTPKTYQKNAQKEGVKP